MSKPKIIAIVCLMAISLVGLVLLQVHWVRSAIALKEQEFDKNVFDALYEVVLEHKKIVTADLVKSFIQTHETVEERVIIINNDTFVLPQSHIHFPDPKDVASGTDAFMDEQEYAVIRRHLPWEDNAPLNSFPSNLRAMQAHMEAMGNSQWYSEVLKGIAGELSFMALPISRKINMTEVRSLLDRRLKKRGIDLDYEFAVNRIGSPEVMCEAKLVAADEVLASDYRANMFPDQFLSQPTFLYVHFPKKFGFLLRTMWIRLGTSVALILLITGCFAFVVWTILRQKKLSDMKSDFINNMTHEFKTPIATLSLAGQAITDPGFVKNPERLDRFGHVILEESRKLGTHVERILQMAMIDKGEMKLSRESVDIHDVVEQLVSNHQLRLKNGNESIVTNLSAKQSVVIGDPVHLSNMIDNLLDNAVKYSKPDHVAVKVITRNEEGQLTLAVTDEGIGMKKETLKHIFDRFYRVSNGNVHNVKGFGLGLSYVRYVVDAHEGEIKVKSEPERGSTFEVRLPA